MMRRATPGAVSMSRGAVSASTRPRWTFAIPNDQQVPESLSGRCVDPDAAGEAIVTR